MIRRKKSASGRSRRKREDSSSSPTRRGSDDVNPPPEFAPYDYESRAPYLLKSLGGQHYPFMSNGFIHLVHELEEMLATNNATKEYMAGEIQFINEGFYPTQDFNLRPMPEFETNDQHQTSPDESSEAQSARASTVQNEDDIAKEAEICLLPEEGEDDDFDEYPAFHVGTRFWTWCRKNFMGKIDAQFLEEFKKIVLDPYSEEQLQKFFVNEPWKYRKRNPQASRRASKNAKKNSISNEVVSPPNGIRTVNRKTSFSGYRIPNRRNSERDKELVNNNKLVPILGSLLSSACKEYNDGKNPPETSTGRRGRSRLTSPEFTRERKIAKMEVDTESEDDDEEVVHNNTQRGPSRLHSPRNVKKEDDEYERIDNGHSSTNGVNGHSKGPASPKRKNGDIRSYFNPVSSKPSTSASYDMNEDNGTEDMEVPSDMDDEYLQAMGSRILKKLMDGGILDKSSKFQQNGTEDDEEGAGTSSTVEMSEEGKDEAEDQEVGELAEKLNELQVELKEEMNARKQLLSLVWKRAKTHFAFSHTFNELKRADYDLFKLGINMYREYPNRKLPGISETTLLKHSLKKRNQLARKHYGRMYRRHPKYRWHQGYVPAGRRLVI
ncbi:unnamed protein product [Caenorhabditis brenneri]